MTRPAFAPLNLFIWIGLGLLASACAPAEERPPAPDPELVEELGLTGDEELYTIRLTGRGDEEWLTPATVEIEAGALVQFVTMDRRIHTISFLSDSLSGAARTFLDETNQQSSPPLAERGSRFVITFEGAPPGRYPFTSEAHGGAAVGAVVVRSPT